MTTTSIVSLAAGALIGITPPAAFAACPTNITGASPGCTNAGTITGINIHSANVSSPINNTGVISTNGIAVNTNSSIVGGITDTGTISGGLSIDHGSGISTTAADETAISIGGPTFSGGITNAGTISAFRTGISLFNLGGFSGGITNSGTISGGSGIFLSNVGSFGGGITNSGVITSAGFGVSVSNVGTFTGDITNNGTISGFGIAVGSVTSFEGNIVNAANATISNGELSAEGVAIFNGNIVNAGTINGQSAIVVGTVSTFTGNVLNSGTITASNGTAAIKVFDGATIHGSITDTGIIVSTDLAGILVDASSVIDSPAAAILIEGRTFIGGILNAGTINVTGAAGAAIFVTGNPAFLQTFAGGITNSGTISSAGDGVVAFNAPTFSGGIVNFGSIKAAGSAIAIGGVSTFSGGVTNGGTLSGGFLAVGLQQISNFSGGISNGGTIRATAFALALDQVTSFAGGISNSGTITATTGLGVLLSLGKTFGGGITNSGTISAGRTGIQVSSISTFGGNISNSGTISAGAIGIEITNLVTFAGGSAIANSGNITGTTAAIDASNATSKVIIDQTGGAIAGAIKLSANADVLNITGGTINGNIVGQGSSDTINISPLGLLATFTYAAPYGFTGINQVNIDSGFVVLNGTNNATNIDVNGGVLFGTGTLDPLTVTIHNGATLAPGGIGAPGTLTINGNLVFQSGATYLVQFGPSGGSLTNISGSASLAGGVDAVVLPGTALARQYTILHSGGLGGTTFDSLTVPAGMTATLTYVNFTDVDINFTGNLSATAAGFNTNQQNVANALNNYFNSGGTLPPAFSTIFGFSGAALANALTQLSGEAATGDQQAATQMMTEFLDMMLDPFVAGRDTGGGTSGAGTATGFAPEKQANLPPSIALAYNAVMPAPRPAAFAQRWSAWGAGFGGSSTTNGNATVGSNNITAATYGVAAGMDYHLTFGSVVGFALAGGGTNWSLAQNLGGGRSDAFQAGVYSKTAFGPAYLAAAFGFANHWFDTSRTAFAGDQLGAKFQGQSYGGRFEAGYRFGALPAVGVTPYGALQAQAFHTPGYSETDPSGGGFGLTYNAMNATDTRSELGARFDALQIVSNMPLVWHGRVAWAHDWVSNPALGATFESLPGASFTVNGAAPPPNSALVSVGGKLFITPAWSFDAKFDGEFASGSQTYAGSGTLRYSW